MPEREKTERGSGLCFPPSSEGGRGKMGDGQRESSESYLNRAGSAWRRQHPREEAVLLSVCGREGLLVPLHLCPGHAGVLL